MSIRSTCRRHVATSKRVFSECREEVAANNLSILRKIGLVGTVFALGYMIVTFFMFHNLQLTLFYSIFIFFLAGITAFSWTASKRRWFSLPQVQFLCTLFMGLVLVFFGLISIIPFTGRPAIFFPIFYLATILLFTFRFWRMQLFSTIFLALFLISVLLFKEPGTHPYDLFGSITAWVLGFPISYFILDLRLKGYEASLRFKINSLTDETTGLQNHRSLNQYIEALEKLATTTHEPIGVIFADIDNFKFYNDTYGHLAGDECLAEIGAVYKSYAEKNGIFIARFGGEELVSLLHGKEQVDRSEEIAQALLMLVRDCGISTAAGKSGYVSVSIGVAYKEHTQKNAVSKLIRQADLAMYQAKADGKNTVAVYRDEMGMPSALPNLLDKGDDLCTSST